MFAKLFSSLLRLLLLGFLFLLLYAPDQFGITFSYALAPLSDHLFLRVCKASLWFLIVLELLRGFYFAVVEKKQKGVFVNSMTPLFMVGLFLIALEMVFLFVPQSHEGVLSKASQIWWAKYWKPVNSFGYRDVEPHSEEGKIQVLVVGDSFSAGHGLKHVGDRFSNQLGDKLGDNYRIHNLGVSGADSGEEAQRLLDYPVKPDIIVIQYFPNDIERVALANGLTVTGGRPFEDVKGLINQLVRRFYLPNFIYWQLPHNQFSTFDAFVEKAYSDSTVLNAHFSDLSKMVSYGESVGAEMYAVFIPFLFQLDISSEHTRPVEQFFKDKGVKVITLTQEIAAIPEEKRIVGRNDGHASAVVNQVIADKLYNAFTVK